MILRRDHVAGAFFVVLGAVVLAFSGDLPWGSMSMPGAGMMPKLILSAMIAFGLILIAQGGDSPPLATIEWSDLVHAICVVAVATAAISVYTVLGFIITISIMLFILLVPIERKPLLPALAFSIGVTVFAYVLFGALLKSPLPSSPFGF